MYFVGASTGEMQENRCEPFFLMLFVLIKKSRNREIRSSELFVIVKIKSKQGYIRLQLRMKAGCIFRLYPVC